METQERELVFPLPDHLLNPGGIISEFCKHVNENSWRVQPNLSLGAAISLMSVITGRKVIDRTGTCTNTYVLNVAETGSGKTNSTDRIWELLRAVDASHLIRPSGFYSEVAMWESLKDHPVLLAVADDFGSYLSSLCDDVPGSLSCRLVYALIRLYSEPTNIIKSTSVPIASRQKIHHPQMSLQGNINQITIKRFSFHHAFQEELLPKLLVFDGIEPLPKLRRELSRTEPSDVLTDRVRQWVEFREKHNTSSDYSDPRIIDYTPEARELLHNCVSRSANFLKTCNEQWRPKWWVSNWSTWIELTKKLALIHACSLYSPSEVVVDENSLQWAWELSTIICRRKHSILQNSETN